jgi:metal transporter CNNM
MEILPLFGLSAILILGSAICSGLNVALLSLDLQDVRRKAKLGNRDAKRALKIRKKVHFYLAGILLTNVMFASGASVVLGDALSGLYAVIVSTILLVTFAEITPQAIAVSRALRAISLFSPAIIFVSYAGYPMTKPLELLLNKLVGKTAQALHSRHELGLLISEHLHKNSELDEDEVEIVQGALQLSEKRVKEIMTPVSKVYFLYEDDIIDADKIDELKAQGRSRIPVFNRKKTSCNSFIMLKDLVDIDFDTTPRRVVELQRHKAVSVGSMTALDTMFRKFIAAKRHMLIVEKDDKIAGIVTIEDLIEEIIGHEIEDESDAARA